MGSMLHTEQEQKPWIRILQLGSESWLGLVGSILFVGDERTPKRLLEPEVPTGLLPCLERPYEVVRAELEERERELSMPVGSLTGAVPLAAIPKAALASQMDHWAALSLSWLAAFPVNDVDEDVLRAIEDSTWASQRTKHRARDIRRSMS
jgi:hypothetical protein